MSEIEDRIIMKLRIAEERAAFRRLGGIAGVLDAKVRANTVVGWVGAVRGFITEIESWLAPLKGAGLHWVREEKRGHDPYLGNYTAPRLNIYSPDGSWMYVEPCGFMGINHSAGLSISAASSRKQVILIRAKDDTADSDKYEWKVVRRTLGNNILQLSFDRDKFLEIVDDFIL